jgi:hypothetical protein
MLIVGGHDLLIPRSHLNSITIARSVAQSVNVSNSFQNGPTIGFIQASKLAVSFLRYRRSEPKSSSRAGQATRHDFRSLKSRRHGLFEFQQILVMISLSGSAIRDFHFAIDCASRAKLMKFARIVDEARRANRRDKLAKV